MRNQHTFYAKLVESMEYVLRIIVNIKSDSFWVIVFKNEL